MARARRLLARRKLPPSKRASRPAFRGRVNDGTNSIEPRQRTSRSLSLPTDNSPRHPTSFRMEHGLYKYTTGVIIPSTSTRRSFGISKAALKAYSGKALSSSECTSVRRLVVAGDNDLPSTSLLGALRHLYNITAKAYTLTDSLTAAFFQVFTDKSTLRSLRLPWITISSASRQWNLTCELYRSHPNASTSVPRICLTIQNFCEPLKMHHSLPVDGREVITVRVSADLRTSILQDNASKVQSHDNATDGSMNASIQTIVDDIVCSMSRVTIRSDFNAHENLITRLRTAISTNLKTSIMTSMVRFRDMEIAIMDWNRQRYVSNIFLNPDGTERFGDADGQDSPRAPITFAGVHKIEYDAISEPTKAKLGANTLHVLVDAPQEAPGASLPISPTELAQEFDLICQNSNETGLECCVKAIRVLEQKHNGFRGRLSFNDFESSFPTPHSTGQAFFNIHSESQSAHQDIEVLTRATTFKARMPESKETTFHIESARLGFDVCQNSGKNLQDIGLAKSTAVDEISVLSLAFASICEQLLQELEFRSLDETPYKLAEAVLETLQMPSSGLTLKAVSLGVRALDDPQTFFRAQASRKTEPQSVEKPSDGMQLKSVNDLARRGEDLDRAKPEAHAVFHQKLLKSKSSLAHATESYTRDAAKELPLNMKGISTPKWTRSKIVESKTGFESFRIVLGWHTTTILPREITAERLIERVEDALRAASGTNGFACQAVLAEMLDLEPVPRYAKAEFGISRLSSPIGVSLSNLRPELDINIITRYDESDNDASRADNRLSVKLPSFAAFANVDGQDLSPDVKAHFMFKMDGQFSHESLHQAKTVAEQMGLGLQIVSKMVASFMENQSFSTFETLVSGLVDAVLERRNELATIIDVQSIQLIAQLRKSSRKSVVLGPIIARAAARRYVNSHKSEDGHASVLSETINAAQDKEGKIAMDEGPGEVQPSELAFSILDQEEPTETDREQDIETYPGDTTLSILEPRNDIEVAKERDAVDEESATTIADTKKLDDETIAALVSTKMRENEATATQVQRERESQPETRTRTAYIALGSNVGDRLINIENACREMDADPDIRLVRTSRLYETKPMYVADQDPFLNGACKIETKLEPLELLNKLQAIEDRLGRVKVIEKGPRSIDLDILLYGDESMTTDRLTIPHPLMHEREFVLRPLCDMKCARDLIVKGQTLKRKLVHLAKASPPMTFIQPLGPKSQYLHAFDSTRATKIMSILNVTPDSFSDGGDNQVGDIEKLQDTIRGQIEAGATIIDIGGQSSRPKAPDVTAEEEISRVLPAIKAIKSLPEAADIAISVDTYRASVAEAAVEAGAHIINDISAGKLDSEMFATVARLGVTYVMMHMRGTPSTMMDPENCTYPERVASEVATELGARLHQAQEAGIRRWRIILDPGFGFSKTPLQNLELLLNLYKVRSWLPNCPLLVGTSRKSFIGKITGVQEPKERVWGTAATVTAAVQGGASIVRVHDVREMADVVKMADAIYRVNSLSDV